MGFAAAARLLVATAAAFCVAAAQAPTHTVTIEGVQFNPPQLTVHVGERIVWVNKDAFPHTATAADKTFDSGSIEADGSWTYIAGKKGAYAYACLFHPTMKGRIIVQ